MAARNEFDANSQRETFTPRTDRSDDLLAEDRSPSRSAVAQRTEGDGDEPQHLHPARVHAHDHYHVTHHHKGGVMGEWDHRTSWHTHEHNHTALRHSHDHARDDEEAEHNKEAHVHDHESPAQSPA